MSRSIIRNHRPHWVRGLLTVAVASCLMTVGATGAQAKVSPPEPQVTSHQHTTWPDDGQLHPNNNPCSEGGPGTDASEGCEEDGGPGGGSAGGGWGGPGERIAVGRDQDPDEAKVKAEDEADDICHGSWALRDFDWDLNLTGRSTYTLTYECV